MVISTFKLCTHNAAFVTISFKIYALLFTIASVVFTNFHCKSIFLLDDLFSMTYLKEFHVFPSVVAIN